MASLGINYIYHHIYNFGTTSVFISIGKIHRAPVANLKGETIIRRVIPIGVVGDERICNGAAYARVYALWRKLAENPKMLETPPEIVKTEVVGTPEWVRNPKAKATASSGAAEQSGDASADTAAETAGSTAEN
jgi:hypothetical protein